MGCWKKIFLIASSIMLKMPIPLALQYQETAVLAEAHCIPVESSYISNTEDSETQLHPFIQEWQSTGEPNL